MQLFAWIKHKWSGSMIEYLKDYYTNKPVRINELKNIASAHKSTTMGKILCWLGHKCKQCKTFKCCTSCLLSVVDHQGLSRSILSCLICNSNTVSYCSLGWSKQCINFLKTPCRSPSIYSSRNIWILCTHQISIHIICSQKSKNISVACCITTTFSF